MHVSAYEGGAVTLEDSAALIDALLANLANSVGASQIGARLQKIGVTAIDPTDAPIALTMAEINSLQQAGIAVAPREATLEDSSADIPPLTVAEIDALSQFGVSSIEVTDGVRLPISVSAAKELVDLPVGSIAVGPAGVTISGAAADIEGLTDSELSALATQDVAQFASTDVPIQLRVDQAQAIEQGYQQGAASEPAVGGPAGAGAIVSDAAWAINGLSASDILAFGAIGVTTLNANDGGSIVFDATPGANQAAALAQAQIGSTSPVTVADTAANIELLTPAQIAQLAAADHVILSATDVQLELSVDQVTALENGGTAPGALLYDLSANIDALTAQQISDLASIGLAGVSASDNAPLVLSVDPSNDQAAALIALMKTGFGVSPGLIILGSAIDIEALSVDAIARIASIGGTLASTDAPLQLTVDQVTALASGGNTGTASGTGPNGAMVYDTAANIAAGLTPFLIANLADLLFIDTIDVFDGPLAVTVAQAEAAASGSVELTAAGLVSVADSEQNIQAIDPATLPALAQAIVQPSQGSGSTRTVIETNDGVSQIVDLAQGLAAGNNGFVFEDPQGVQIQDTEQTIQSFDASQFQKLAQGVEKPSSGSGQAAPTIILTSDGVQQIVSVAQGVAAGQNGFVFEDAQGIEIQDTAQNIQGLGAGDFATLAKAIDNTSGNPTIIDVVDGLALTLSIAQAIAAGNGNFLFEDSDGVEIDDTTANFEQLGPSDYATLHAAIDGPGAPNPTPSTVLRTTDGQVLTLTLNDAAAALGYGFEFEGPLSIEITGSVKDLLALTPQQVALLSDVGANAAVAITDSTSDIQALTAPQITEISTFGASSITSTDGSLTFDTTQALAAAAGDISFDVPTGDNVSVVDAAAAFGDLTAQQIAGLGDDGFDALASTSGSLALDVSQGLAAAAADLSVSAPSGDQTAVVDAAAAFGDLTAQQIAGLGDDGFDALASTSGSLALDVSQGLAAAAADLSVSAPSGDQTAVADAAAAFGDLTAQQIAGLGDDGFDALASTSGSLALDVSQGLAAAAADLSVSAPSGDQTAVADAAAAFGDLTAQQIAGLGDDGFDALASTSGSLALDVSQGLAAAAADLSVSAPSGDQTAVADAAAAFGDLTAQQIAGLGDDGFDALASTSGSLALDVSQGLAAAAADLSVSAPSGDQTAVADAAAAFGDLTAQQIAGLGDDGFDALASTSGSLALDVSQGLAAAAADLSVSAPSGDQTAVADAAAAFGDLTAQQIAGLGDDGFDALASTSGSLALDVSQGLAAAAADLSVSAPSGDQTAVVDAAAALGSLTAGQIGQLSRSGFTQLDSTAGSVTLDAAQAIALEDPMTVVAPAGDTVTLSDTAAAIEALTAAEIAAAGSVGFTNLVATDASLQFTVAQALAIEFANLHVSVPQGDAATVVDSSANLATLTSAEIAALAALGVIVPSAPPGYSVAYYLANQTTLDASGNIAIADTAVNVAANLDALNADSHIASIALTDGGTPTLTLSVEQAVNDRAALAKIVSAYTASVADTAVNIAEITSAQAAALKTDGYASVASTTGAIKMTTAEALLLIGDGVAVTGGALIATGSAATIAALTSVQDSALAAAGYALEVVDVASDIEALTPAKIAGLGNLHVAEVEASDASLAVSATQAIAFENAHILLTAPPGDSVSLADTAAHLRALTATAISALKAAGVDAVTSSNGAVAFTVAQALALEGAGLAASAIGGAVTLADGAGHIGTLDRSRDRGAADDRLQRGEFDQLDAYADRCSSDRFRDDCGHAHGSGRRQDHDLRRGFERRPAYRPANLRPAGDRRQRYLGDGGEPDPQRRTGCGVGDGGSDAVGARRQCRHDRG